MLVPLFWSQPGYSLKPAPVLAADRTRSQHLDALRRHFQKIVGQYGPSVRSTLYSQHRRLRSRQSIVNLSEQHGKEAPVTVGYREYVSELAWDDVQSVLYSIFRCGSVLKLDRYTEYDFHAETKGMKYVNNVTPIKILSTPQGMRRYHC